MTNSKDFIDVVHKRLEEMIYKLITIVLINPFDILEGVIDLNDYYNNTWFVPNSSIKRGQVFIIDDDNSLKKEYYQFGSEHPDRIFKGCKETNKEYHLIGKG